MSKNCVDSTVEIVNLYKIPILLIASRRQIDSEEFGGGYVNDWNTRTFANYIKKIDKNNNIILSRDHGGPWQNNLEIKKNYNLKESMDSCKRSYKEDIDNDFKIIHIDPSIDPFKKLNSKIILERVKELLLFCHEYAKKKGKEIYFEIGTEEQSGYTNTFEELEFSLIEIKKFCVQNNIPKPIFIVVQTGTKVIETENIGTFDAPIRIKSEIPAEIQVPLAIDICNKYQIMVKEHNTDYLSEEALKWHPRLGIHAANVAPEFGVTETKSFIDILKKYNLTKEINEFMELSYKSYKWKKWLKDNTKTTDEEKAIISGHYIFSKKEFKNIKSRTEFKLMQFNIDLDKYLKEQIKKSIYKYLNNFRLIK